MMRDILEVSATQAAVASAALVGDSAATHVIRRSITALAPTGAHVLFTGETGSGRRIWAEILHRESPHRDRPFLHVSLGAATDAQIATQLFGPRGVAGLAAQARGVTVYLDHVDRLPLELQARLCEALQDGETPGVRVLAATTRSLESAVRLGTFSRALYDRIALVQIGVPPLRERAGDIPLIARHAVGTWNERRIGSPRRLGPGAVEVLEGHSWPGNVRELVEVVHGACARTRARTLSAERLRVVLGRRPRRAAARDVAPLRRVERDYILHVVARCDGNQSLAARYLEIGRGTLARKLRETERPAVRVAS
jgi:DNA-binding NtrC family response regulator